MSKKQQGRKSNKERQAFPVRLAVDKKLRASQDSVIREGFSLAQLRGRVKSFNDFAVQALIEKSEYEMKLQHRRQPR